MDCPPNNVAVACPAIPKDKGKLLLNRWWKKWLRNPLPHNGAEQQPESKQHDQSGVQSGRPTPTTTTLAAAPPKTALPLSQLTDDQLVTLAPSQSPRDY